LLPESRARAALLAQLRRRPGAAGLAAAPLLALARVLGAHASEPAGLGRWIAAVFAAYRVVLTHARLWEWRQGHPAPGGGGAGAGPAGAAISRGGRGRA